MIWQTVLDVIDAVESWIAGQSYWVQVVVLLAVLGPLCYLLAGVIDRVVEAVFAWHSRRDLEPGRSDADSAAGRQDTAEAADPLVSPPPPPSPAAAAETEPPATGTTTTGTPAGRADHAGADHLCPDQADAEQVETDQVSTDRVSTDRVSTDQVGAEPGDTGAGSTPHSQTVRAKANQ